MRLWVEKNLPALLLGGGIGCAVGGLLASALWPVFGLAGIAIALPIWQVYRG